MAELDSVKRFLDSGAGKVLKDHMLSRLYELRDIGNIKEVGTPTHQTIELKAQLRAYLKVREIYNDLMTLSGEVKSRDPRDSFNVE